MELFFITIINHTGRIQTPFRCVVVAESKSIAIDALSSLHATGTITIKTISDIHSPDDLRKKPESVYYNILESLQCVIHQPYGKREWVKEQYEEPNIRLLNYVYKKSLTIYTVDKYLDQTSELHIKASIGYDNGVSVDRVRVVPYFYKQENPETPEESVTDISPILVREERFLKAFLFPKTYSVNDIQRMVVIKEKEMEVTSQVSFYVNTENLLYRIDSERQMLRFNPIIG